MVYDKYSISFASPKWVILSLTNDFPALNLCADDTMRAEKIWQRSSFAMSV